MRSIVPGSWLMVLGLVASARSDDPKPAPLPLEQRGTEIVVCGQRVQIGTPVILWTDPGGHNAYAPKAAKSAPASDGKVETKSISPGFGPRRQGLSPAQLAEIQKTGWTLPQLQGAVDQFVLHYDVCGTSKKCFEVLQERNLSVHFMLDLDGTIYQTLDLKEAAYHATKANGRSVGIEIANMGAYPHAELAKSPLSRWYERDAAGITQIRVPATASVPTLPPGAKPLRPIRSDPVLGTVQKQELTMYDLTPQQYDALIKLTAGLCATFPKIRPEVPREPNGDVTNHKLEDDAYLGYGGILGHYHVQANKTDPGPAFQWDRLIQGIKTQPSTK